MTYVRKGTMADVPPGSALETAYGGSGNLRALTFGEVAIPRPATARGKVIEGGRAELMGIIRARRPVRPDRDHGADARPGAVTGGLPRRYLAGDPASFSRPYRCLSAACRSRSRQPTRELPFRLAGLPGATP